MAKDATIKIPFDRETKNMLRFQFSDDQKNSSPIPTLYVGKSMFTDRGPGNWPAFLEVTIKGVDK